ncbi:hypothetical protein DXV75_14115 [Alteromonas aestuariivivens]|uniref:Uncharacterized protein n=1 Tax=Alteromonas aestuariivivens TaxID=1938339 RepID=A0A3D8M3Z1_9ALTE|nr:hypothetical protein [Alteromonas aestuariivivens]RDV24351.1 hypothetical protein DXV75_14115 [Alteromonas aestuariivivens]
MVPGPDPLSSQTDFFANPGESVTQQPQFAELCNALYERELRYLANQGPSQPRLLKRRLSGLSHHVKRAAYFLASNSYPIDVDSHNASWQARQANRSPARTADSDKTAEWFRRYAQHGLVVCIRVQQLDNEHIELDSIDRVQTESRSLHVNKHGWFSFDGEYLDTPDSANTQKQLLKPSKPVMTAACCGHSWNHKGKISPRALTLREMLLSTQIDWKHFRLPTI